MTIEALSSAAAALQEVVATFQAETDRLKSLFGSYPPGVETVLTFGDGTDYPEFWDLWETIKDKPVTGPLRIQFPAGTHFIDRRMIVGPHPWAQNIRFIGDTTNPENVKLHILNGGGTHKKKINGFELNGMIGSEFSGFQIEGAGVGSDALGLAITNGSQIYSQDGTLIVKDLDLGIWVNGAAYLDTKEMTFTGCENGIWAHDGGLVSMPSSTFVGRGRTTGVAIKAADGSTIQCASCQVSEFKKGIISTTGAHIGSEQSFIQNCESGFISSAASHWSYGTSGLTDYGTSQCDIGYEVDAGGNLYVNWAHSENDTTAFYADSGGVIWATNAKIIQNDTNLVPAAVPDDHYHIQADEFAYIHTAPTTWDTTRDPLKQSVAGSGSLIVA